MRLLQMLSFAVLAGVTGVLAGAVANERNMELLIQPEDLRRSLDHGDRRILDVRGAAAYAESHVPGAVHVDVNDWRRLSLSDGGLHDAAAWSERIGRLGIDREVPVVVYGDNVTEAARVWWLLKYVGVRQVALLDGGWEAWVGAEGPVEEGAAQVAPRAFTPAFQADRLEEIETLKESLGGQDLTVVDARSDAEFTGQEVRGPRGGHIPGSVHLEWKDLLRPDGRFKSAEDLRTLFRERGIEPDRTAITC